MKTLKIFTSGKSKVVFLIALLANLLIIGAYYFAFAKVREKNRHVAELFGSIEALSAREGSFQSNKEKVADTASLRSKLDGYVIKKDGMVAFLNSIQSLGAENGVALKVASVSVEESDVSPDVFDSVKISIEVSGSWSDVYRFSALAELAPFKVSVDSVDLERVSENEPPGSSKKLPTNSWEGVVGLSVLKLK